MKYFLFFSLILCFFISYSQRCDTVKNGFCRFYYPDGKVSSEGYLVNGKPDGYWKAFYPNGTIKSEGNRKNFLLDSIWKFYNENGRLTMSIEYRNGKKNGKKITYKDDKIIEESYVDDIKDGWMITYSIYGRKLSEVKYENGIPIGTEKEYDEEGNVIRLKEYRNGYLILDEIINRYDENKLKNGKWKEFYPDGKIKSEVTYRNGKKWGYYKEWDKEGNLIQLKKYENDVEKIEVPELASIEVRYDYYENGRVKIRGSYKNGVPEGIRKEYDSSGNVVRSYIFKNGALIGEGIIDEAGYKQGEWKEYYETGQLLGEGKYVNSQRTGLWKYYHINGKLEQIGNFNPPEKPDGEWKWYYDNGQLRREMTYDRGIEEGMMIEYSDSGEIILKGKYVEGMKEGKWYSFTGDFIEEGEYKNGVRNGIWIGKYKNGVIAYEGNFTDDLPDGKFTFYKPSGKVYKTGRYIMGKKDGEWIELDENNNVFLSIRFKNGIETSYDGVLIKPEFEQSDFDFQY